MKIQGEFETTTEAAKITKDGRKNKWILVLSLVFLVSVAAVIPIADNVVPADKLLCENESYLPKVSPLYNGNPVNVHFLIGRVLYPRITENNLAFTLLTCQGSFPLEIQDFDSKIESGQLVITALKYPIGLLETEILISYENGIPVVLWEK